MNTATDSFHSITLEIYVFSIGILLAQYNNSRSIHSTNQLTTLITTSQLSAPQETLAVSAITLAIVTAVFFALFIAVCMLTLALLMDVSYRYSSGINLLS